MRTSTALTFAAALALGACSSDGDGTTTDIGPDAPTGTTVDGTDPGTSDPATSGPAPGADETSAPAPGFDPDAPPSSEPGGDTGAVAGLWNASGAGAPAGDYVEIAGNGLWTRYTLDEGGDNCFDADGPYTLMLEIAASNEYSLSSEDEGVTLVADGDVLTYRLGADGEIENWPRVNGEITVEDLESQACPSI